MLNRWQSTIVDAQGNVQPLANLTVRNESDQSLAKMWASPGTSQPLPDGMVQADGNGYAYFYAEGGLYRITSVALGIDWRHVPLGELAGMDVADLGLGTAATRDVGTGPNETPTNDDLGPAAFISIDELQWLGTPIGGYITPLSVPPKDDPRFRYVLCTAGETGSGGYNEGVLTSESVTGTAPLVEATAVVDLAGSPFDGLTIHLINTEGRFIGAGTAEAFENDSIQNITGSIVIRGSDADGPTTGALTRDFTGQQSGYAGTSNGAISTLQLQANLVARTSDHTQPRAHRLPHYRRIL